jgi:hypothetical protein
MWMRTGKRLIQRGHGFAPVAVGGEADGAQRDRASMTADEPTDLAGASAKNGRLPRR